MDDVCWFFIAVMLSVGGWMLGRRAGLAGDRATRMAAFLGISSLLAWTWMLRHPSVGVQLVPLWALARLEGVGSVPSFALVLGVCWQRARLSRQRMAVGWAAALGIVYLFNGGGWLLKPSPDAAFGADVTPGPGRGLLQSQDYSCVAAACATLLHGWGYPASEAEMVHLTRTRAGSGSTTLRALEGLSRRLVGSQLQPVLLEVELGDLRALPTPLLTPLRYGHTREHMVVIDRVENGAYVVSDPLAGVYSLQEYMFAPLFTGRVIAIEQRP